MKMDFTLRAANVEDCKDLARMELSEHEKIAHKMKLTQKDLEQNGFCKNPFFHGIIAEVPEHLKTKEGHIKIGYAIYFYSWSSMSGRVIYMEDLYVMPEFRGKGIGKALMSKVAQLGLAAGCTQLNFAVLDWNKPSLEFYFHQGCYDFTAESGYHLMRCEGEALENWPSCRWMLR
ncbi:thialysine N-epsilon-acetyltransferase-like isoform X2 [Takifugu flavidus]|uniref:thialysine N-epsilon-acetyltransferase-like isoform X2 n=1 Tax=Takifugu flavidus TaxID=433684 RepID=UPI002544B427|nr:thialysine N-epsilon-acetyltransferase-like isoform X2 [Takifugu flavidus]